LFTPFPIKICKAFGGDFTKFSLKHSILEKGHFFFLSLYVQERELLSDLAKLNGHSVYQLQPCKLTDTHTHTHTQYLCQCWERSFPPSFWCSNTRQSYRTSIYKTGV